MEKIIQQLEKVSVGSLPSVHLLTLENVDSEALATLMTDVYEQLAELRQRTTGNNQKTAAFLPVVQPNALLIISSEVERESILELAVSLDKPLTPDLEFEVFPLKSAHCLAGGDLAGHILRRPPWSGYVTADVC